MIAYDFWKTIDHQGERDSLEQARLEHLAQQIRSDMKPRDFIQEIDQDASFDTDCIKAIQMLFIGADPVTCAKVLTKFADGWLDRQSMKLAQEYCK
jgi:hypothetical protein